MLNRRIEIGEQSRASKGKKYDRPTGSLLGKERPLSKPLWCNTNCVESTPRHRLACSPFSSIICLYDHWLNCECPAHYDAATSNESILFIADHYRMAFRHLTRNLLRLVKPTSVNTRLFSSVQHRSLPCQNFNLVPRYTSMRTFSSVQTNDNAYRDLETFLEKEIQLEKTAQKHPTNLPSIANFQVGWDWCVDVSYRHCWT